MTCSEFESVLADYLDNSLSSAGRAAVEEHLAGCSDCRIFLEEVTGGRAMLKQAAPVEPPAELITRIAYLAPAGRAQQPFERETLFGNCAANGSLPCYSRAWRWAWP